MFEGFFQSSGFYFQSSDLRWQVVVGGTTADPRWQVVVGETAAVSPRRQAIIRNALGLKSLHRTFLVASQHNTHDQQDRQSKRASEHGVRYNVE
jgi:hypothetical protein